jgi:ribose transport system permease protein
VGGVVPVILGSVFITMMSNAMNLLRVDGYIQQILLGVIIIAAIFLDRIRTTRS